MRNLTNKQREGSHFRIMMEIYFPLVTPKRNVTESHLEIALIRS